MPSVILQRLLDPSSVTYYLEERLQKRLSLEVTNMGWYYPKSSEAAYIKLKPWEKAWLREICLRDNTHICLYAWSLFPEKLFIGKYKMLQRLGTKSVEKILVEQASTSRSEFEIAPVQAEHPLYQKLTRGLVEKPALLWARRSGFNLDNHTILVNEVFLPQFFN